MNRGNKIKAYVLLLSWLMILAHSVIPHNHADSDFVTAENSIRKPSVSCQHLTSISNCLPDEESCRISGLLFHKFQDDNFIQEDRNSITKPVTAFSKYYSDLKSDFPGGDYAGTSCPRAPPRAHA